MAFFASEGDDDGGGSLWSQVSLFNTARYASACSHRPQASCARSPPADPRRSQHRSPVQDILDKDEFTLQELLEEDELLQEVKAQNKKLLDLYVHVLHSALTAPSFPAPHSAAQLVLIPPTPRSRAYALRLSLRHPASRWRAAWPR